MCVKVLVCMHLHLQEVHAPKTYRLGNVEARENIPGRDERGQDCGGNLKVGGHIHAHDAHVSEVVQGQQQKEQEPEEFACM